MHEMSLVGSIIDIVEEYSARHGFCRVNTIKLSFGALSCIDPSALKMAFDVLSQDTRAAGAGLDYVIHPITVHCITCEQDHEVSEYPCACPGCSGDEVALMGGFEELRLEEMDVD
jgi:hydrogenase nickel incorporation protein HypA/HybF